LLKVILPDEYSFCFGVERALELARKHMQNGNSFDTLGEIIHNPHVVKEFEKKGIRVINSPEESHKKKILIRSHGVPPSVIEKIKSLGKEIIDATCPFVKHAHDSARKLIDEGYFLLIIGKKDHPEVIGIQGYAYGKGCVVLSESDVEKLNLKGKKVGLVSQTTMLLGNVQEVITAVLKQNPKEVRYINTRCSTTERRQNATKELAKKVDVMVIVGGRHSSNTNRLYEIAKEHAPAAYLVESHEELKPEWFEKAKIVGITGGASTPPEDVLKVKETIEKFSQGGK